MSMYYCHNKPRQKNKYYTFQNGWRRTCVGFVPNITAIKTRFSTECQHITSFKDAECEGCQHRRGDTNE